MEPDWLQLPIIYKEQKMKSHSHALHMNVTFNESILLAVAWTWDAPFHTYWSVDTKPPWFPADHITLCKNCSTRNNMKTALFLSNGSLVTHIDPIQKLADIFLLHMTFLQQNPPSPKKRTKWFRNNKTYVANDQQHETAKELEQEHCQMMEETLQHYHSQMHQLQHPLQNTTNHKKSPAVFKTLTIDNISPDLWVQQTGTQAQCHSLLELAHLSPSQIASLSHLPACLPCVPVHPSHSIKSETH